MILQDRLVTQEKMPQIASVIWMLLMLPLYGMGAGNGLKSGVLVRQKVQKNALIVDGDAVYVRSSWMIWLVGTGMIRMMNQS